MFYATYMAAYHVLEEILYNVWQSTLQAVAALSGVVVLHAPLTLQ